MIAIPAAVVVLLAGCSGSNARNGFRILGEFASEIGSAAYGEAPGSAASTWAERIENLGDLAYDEPDQQELAGLKLARDAAVHGFQRAYCT
ncbi:hypothetical protein [Agromyces sp. SYSU T00266]|uniref:hypothetical protein n=1 Tax=Agromyces zhanjiangensis TaxID=3158562 RepID=UPI003399101D